MFLLTLLAFLSVVVLTDGHKPFFQPWLDDRFRKHVCDATSGVVPEVRVVDRTGLLSQAGTLTSAACTYIETLQTQISVGLGVNVAGAQCQITGNRIVLTLAFTENGEALDETLTCAVDVVIVNTCREARNPSIAAADKKRAVKQSTPCLQRTNREDCHAGCLSSGFFGSCECVFDFLTDPNTVGNDQTPDSCDSENGPCCFNAPCQNAQGEDDAALEESCDALGGGENYCAFNEESTATDGTVVPASCGCRAPLIDANTTFPFGSVINIDEVAPFDCVCPFFSFQDWLDHYQATGEYLDCVDPNGGGGGGDLPDFVVGRVSRHLARIISSLNRQNFMFQCRVRRFRLYYKICRLHPNKNVCVKLLRKKCDDFRRRFIAKGIPCIFGTNTDSFCELVVAHGSNANIVDEDGDFEIEIEEFDEAEVDRIPVDEKASSASTVYASAALLGALALFL